MESTVKLIAKANTIVLHSGDDFYAEKKFTTFNFNGIGFRLNGASDSY